MDVKVKLLHQDADLPFYSKQGDACADLTCVGVTEEEYYIEYSTGVALEIPEGYLGLVFPRSSVTNKELLLKNSVGVIDSGYRGEIKFRFYPYNGYNTFKKYYIGDRIGQLLIIPYPKINFVEVEELSDSQRGEGGFGSTGN